MIKKAFLILLINKETKKIDNAAIYGEEYPTIDLKKYFSVVALKAEAKDYETARNFLHDGVINCFKHYEWLKDTPGLDWAKILKVYNKEVN